MRLADFIDAKTEEILDEWVAFARTCGPAETMDLEGLRDHATQMLAAFSRDLRTAQSAAEQTQKSKGQAPPLPAGADDTAAEVHGAARAGSGFTVGEMVSEYRALRASVLRLWTKSRGTLADADVQDMMRFNEAIDQALAESTQRYSSNLDQARELFVAILGHDLRTPIGAVVTSSQFMLDTGELEEPHRSLTTRIARTARRMNDMVGDLLDFTLVRLGSGIPVVRAPMDMAATAASAVEETAAAYPEHDLRLETSGDLTGHWDAARVSQVLSNLLGNAVQHGSATDPVVLSARGDREGVTLRVRNRGTPIPAAELDGLFDPLKRLRGGGVVAHRGGNLGLGLHVAERVVLAHGGTIGVESTEADGTTFTVHLPR